jgi:threonine/homoserine/homoserine lactone efflux protein
MSPLLSFALTCLVIELTPGPNMGYLAVLSASEGRRAGLAATLGIGLGLLILSTAAALGLSAVISQSPMIYNAMRWGGVFFLFWLAWEAWVSASETSPAVATGADHDLKYFTRGLMTNVLNPKAGLFYVAVLPTFIDASRPVVAQTLSLSVLSVAIATCVHTAIVGLAGAARPWLEEGERSKIVRRAMALLLAVIAIWLLFATKR